MKNSHDGTSRKQRSVNSDKCVLRFNVTLTRNLLKRNKQRTAKVGAALKAQNIHRGLLLRKILALFEENFS